MRRKKNYTMVKLNVPKRVTLLNGRTFIAWYKRIKRSELPPNIVMRRTYTQRAAPRYRKFFQDKENEEIKKNYMGVYSMDLITRYILL